MAETNRPQNRADTPTIELGEEMVVTDADLDRIYGTDQAHTSPTSLIDEERNEMREEGSWDEDPAQPIPTSLMSAEDFHDDVDDAAHPKNPVDNATDWRDEIIPLPRLEERAVVRPHETRRTGMLLKLLIPFWIAVLVGVGVIYNSQVQQTWSVGQDLAQTLKDISGFSPEPGEGLAIQKDPPQREVRGGIDFFIFNGQVENITTKTIQVPLLHLEIMNSVNKVLHSKSKALDVDELAPGQSTPYRIEISPIPETARTATLRFLSETETPNFDGRRHER